MKMAFDSRLEDYVNAESVMDFDDEQYRYKCLNCGEYVHLCAADSKLKSPHFRHLDGNNNVECENYLGNNSCKCIKSNENKKIREKADFYFKFNENSFYLSIKLSKEEILKCEEENSFLDIRNVNNSKDSQHIRINSDNFFPNNPEMIQLEFFAWKYNLKSGNENRWFSYEVFNKDSNDNINPTFFKIQTDNDEFTKAKLIMRKTLYTNINYLIIIPAEDYEFNFETSIRVSKRLKFNTMDKEFSGAIISFTEINNAVIKQLSNWGYDIERYETILLLWPPSSEIEGEQQIKSSYAYLSSSFIIKAHSNTNADDKNIVASDNITRILIDNSKRINVIYKNAELSIVKSESSIFKYYLLNVSNENTMYCKTNDSNYYYFNSYGVTRLDSSTKVLLSKNCKILHYSSQYLDKVIYPLGYRFEFDNKFEFINYILKYYKRTEYFNYNDFVGIELSNVASKIIENSKKSGIINSAVKHYILGGQL